MIKIINTIWKKLTSVGFREIFLLSSIFVVILFIEKEFFPKSSDLIKLNVLGRTSVVLAFIFIVIFFVMERRRLFALKKIEFNYKIFFIALCVHLISFFAFIKLKQEVVTRPEILSSNLNFYLLAFLRYLFPLLIFSSLGFIVFGIKIIKQFYKSFFVSLILT